MSFIKSWHRKAALPAAIAAFAAPALAQDEDGTRLDFSGFAMLDMGYQKNQNHPDWFDVVRPTKLPSFEDEFGAGRQLLRRRAAKPLRCQELHAHGDG